MLSAADLTARKIEAATREAEASECEFLADVISGWRDQLEEMYRRGWSDEAAGLCDQLGNMIGEMQRKAADARF